MPTAVRRLCGHFDAGPNGVDAQLSAAIRAAISPWPANGEALAGR
jgi:hypothetical protein